MTACRGCGDADTVRVLDLGRVPAADFFPSGTAPLREDEAAHDLAMNVCRGCGLAQLADDDSVTQEPRGIEPQALRDQAAAAVADVEAAGWLTGSTVREFGSPHGGSWLPLLRDLRSTAAPADVVVDCFGIMHEPDQKAAFLRRAAVTRPGGVLLLQYHSLAAILAQGQWNALRHGHFAYYSMPTLIRLLGAAGMSVAHAWDFDLYGGTVLVAAVHGSTDRHESVQRILAAENAMGVTAPDAVARLQVHADGHRTSLRRWLEEQAAAGCTVMAYGAASRAVALFSRAALTSRLVAAVADASPAKQGRRMPATDIPIVSPDTLRAAQPDRVLLTVPDLLPEITAQFPELAHRFVVETAVLAAHG